MAWVFRIATGALMYVTLAYYHAPLPVYVAVILYGFAIHMTAPHQTGNK